jgi:hypothetical protein
MGGKMNWDRVGKENLMARRGFTYGETGTVTDDLMSPKLKAMPRCICGKAVGFRGAHQKKCPLVTKGPTTPKRPALPNQRVPGLVRQTLTASLLQDPPLSSLAEALRKAEVSHYWKESLALQIRLIDCNPKLNELTRKETKAVIEAFLRKL